MTRDVVILCGGRSAEHEVSLISARSVIHNLDREKYRIRILGIRKDGTSYSAEELRARLVVIPQENLELPSTPHWVRFLQEQDPDTTVVFPVLHGPYGEDGTVQGLLEILDIPFVGAGVCGSAVGMNKILCKSILRDHGLPVLPWLAVNQVEWSGRKEVFPDLVAKGPGFPVFVKPANMGSSVGVSKVDEPFGVAEAIETAMHYDDHVIVEQGIEAREIEVSVLGSFKPLVSIPGEIVPSDEFYSYEAKYLSEDSQLLIPAPLEDSQTELVQDLARRAFQLLHLEGMARVDFLIDKGDGKIWINEPNTIPGFTQISMYPKLWEASGLSYPELLDELIQLGIERHQRRSELKVDR
jgi:D-alanine-D-alanine ligase